MNDTKSETGKLKKLKLVEAALGEAQQQLMGLSAPTLEYIISMALLEVAEQCDQFE